MLCFHVRRGDKLIAEAKYWVDEYWAKEEYNETTQPSITFLSHNT
jgi:hypothetical protein